MNNSASRHRRQPGDCVSTPRKRVALAGLFEEVNTFAVESMGFSTITGDIMTGFAVYEGQAMVREYQGSSTQIGGYLDALEQSNVEILPLIQYGYSAGPTIHADAYAEMKQSIVGRITDALPLDGIALTLHGAAVADGVDDVEGDLCAAIRSAVGPNVKMVLALDHHGTLTDFNRQQVDFITIVKNYPHTDFHEVAYRAAKVLVDMMDGRVEPFGHLERLPFVMQTISTMPGNLYAPIREKTEEFARRPGILELSFQYGFPYADISHNTALVNCWAQSQEIARSTAKEFARWVWKNRERFVLEPCSARAAVDAAEAALISQGRVAPGDLYAAQRSPDEPLQDAPETFGFLPDKLNRGPVVIAEKSDNPGAGAPGDGTHLLAEILKRKLKQVCVASIRDQQTVTQAVAAGVGSVIDVALGGKFSKSGGSPIRAKAYVKAISDGRYTVSGPMLTGLRLGIGQSVHLLIDGVSVVVVSGLMQVFDKGQLREVGVDPLDYRIVVLKSANHFRAWWSNVASVLIDSDTPGIASGDLRTFDYKNKRGKVYPLDADATYE